MDKQIRVRKLKTNLLLRVAGYRDAPVLAIIPPEVIVHVTGPANPQGYAPAYSAGHLDVDGKTLRADSLARSVNVNAILLVPAAFQADGPADEYGRTPGRITGYIFEALTEPLRP